MWRSFLLFVVLLLAPAPGTAASERSDFVDLTGATVLASPGAPEGMVPFLPGGRAPKPLTWPLPGGPVLVLGLPGSDPAARDLAFFWDLLGPGEDLHGGYLVAAWHDGTRPIAVVLGDDAAALMAARFELEDVPRRPGMETLDFSKPPAEAGLRLRSGRRAFRPRFRIRAYAPNRVTPESVLTAIAGHANRYWIEAGKDRNTYDAIPSLVRHGVAPCVLLPAGAGEGAAAVAERAAPWIRRGVRHLVLSPTGFDVDADDLRHQVSQLLAGFDLAEIVVLGDVLQVPGALGTWFPGRTHGDRDTAARARAAIASADVPLLFVESWARASRTPVPSRPRGLPAGLGRLFAGAVVLDGPGAREALEEAWAPGEEAAEEWETVLLPLLPRQPLAPRAFLEETIARLEGLGAPTRRTVDWLDPLLVSLRTSVGDLANDAVLVPRVPAPVTLDGRLDEAAWAWAARIDVPLPTRAPSGTATLLAVADGHELHVALRAPEDLTDLPLAIRTEAWDDPFFGGDDTRITSSGAVRQAEGVRTWEVTLDHYDLHGDAHPTRVLYLWHVPAEGPPRRIATLVLGP